MKSCKPFPRYGLHAPARCRIRTGQNGDAPLFRTPALVATLAALCAVTPACASPVRSDDGSETKADTSRPPEETRPVTNPQPPLNERFGTFDEYLAFLRQRGALDMPWWREVEPGVYELVTSYRPVDGQAPQRATREELMRRFGFTR